jgi:hypothetical protein
MITDRYRLWLAGGALALAVALAVGWFAVVSPEMSAAASRRDDTAAAEFANLALQRQVAGLRAQTAQIAALEQQLHAAQAALPATAGIDTFTTQLSQYAHATQVLLTAITVGPPAVLAGGGRPAGKAPVANAPATRAPAPRAVSGSLYSIDVSVVTTGTGAAQQAFLNRVQYGARAALVRSAALAPSSAVHSLDAPSTMTLSLRVFVEPQAPTAGRAPTAAPAASPTTSG